MYILWRRGGEAAHLDLMLTLQQCLRPQQHSNQEGRKEPITVWGEVTNLHTEHEVKLLMLGVLTWMRIVKCCFIAIPQP